MIPYATPEQLAGYSSFPDGLPDNAPQLLKAATRMVRHYVRFARYDTNPAGQATELDVIDALQDATCLQVMAWLSAGVDPLAGPAALEAPVVSSSVAGASITYDAAAATAAKADLLHNLVPMAQDVLDTAGLGAAGVATW